MLHARLGRTCAIALWASVLVLSCLPAAAQAAVCCLCSHAQISGGRFCLKDIADCSTLQSSTNADLKNAQCVQDTGANPCKKVPKGSCLNEPSDEMTFKLASVPGYKASADTGTSQPSGLNFKLNINIPGLTFLAPYSEGGEIFIPMLAQYLQAVQKMMIGIGLVAAAIMLVYGGWLYIISGTGIKVTDGKKIIIDALIGMVIILGSVVILSNLNPNTATLSALRLADIKQQMFELSTGYDSGETGGESDFTCDECPNMKNPSFKGAASRMKAACKGGGGQENLKRIIQAWVKEAAPDGSGYIRGGSGYGKEMKLASPHTGFIFCSLGKYNWITEETKTACGLPTGFKFDPNRTSGHCVNGETIRISHRDFSGNTLLAEAHKTKKKGPCYEALKKNYASHFVCPMKCNDLFGADCSGFPGALFACAGVRRNGLAIETLHGQAVAEAGFPGAAPPAVPPLICRNKGGGFLSASDPKCAGGGSDQCKCEPFKEGFAVIALTKEQFMSHSGSFQFGTTMEKDCQGGSIAHMFVYTGRAGLPYEVIQSGGGGDGPSFLDWKGLSEFKVGRGINTVSSLDGYLSSCNVRYLYAVNGFASL